MRFMQIESVLQTKNRSEPAKNRFSVALPIVTFTVIAQSLRIRYVWSEASLCTLMIAKDLSFPHVDIEDWSDWVDAQVDLSLRWAHMPFCWFGHEVAKI